MRPCPLGASKCTGYGRMSFERRGRTVLFRAERRASLRSPHLVTVDLMHALELRILPLSLCAFRFGGGPLEWPHPTTAGNGHENPDVAPSRRAFSSRPCVVNVSRTAVLKVPMAIF